MFKKILSGLLAALMILPLTACGVSDTADTKSTMEPVTDAESEKETIAFPAVEKKDYGKAPFHMVRLLDGATWYYLDDDENTHGVLESAIVEMNHMVEEHLNVELSMEIVDKITTGGEVFDRVRPSMTAGDDDYQLCILHPYYSYNSFISRNFAKDFRDLPDVCTEREYWNKPVMDALSLNDHTYIGLGDLCRYQLNILYANKQLLKDAQREVPYDKVRNGTWTFDEFLAATTELYADDNGNGKQDCHDIYGFASLWDANATSFMQASDIYVLKRNAEESFDLSIYSERLENLYGKIVEWNKDPSVWLWMYPEQGNPDKEIDFLNKHVYYTCQSLGVQFLEATFDVAVLPMPKYDTNQKDYAHVNWGNNIIVPATVRNTTMVGEVLEMMGYYSRTIVLDAYYNTVLQYRVSNAPDDREMVELIYNTVTYDPGIAFCDGEQSLWFLVYTLMYSGRENPESCSSFYKKYERGAERSIRNIVKRFSRNP